MLRTAVGSSENINIIVIVAFLWEDQISDPIDHSVHAAYRGSNETLWTGIPLMQCTMA